MANDNQWRYYNDNDNNNNNNSKNNNKNTDWMAVMESKQDGSFWTSFEPTPEHDNDNDDNDSSDNRSTSSNDNNVVNDVDDDESEAWLDILVTLSAEEVEFNQKEGERADMLRKMEEYQFSPEIIAATLGVATDTKLEDELESTELENYRIQLSKSTMDDTIDLETVESHTQVPIDPETKEPIRSQMVYVDEHTCIGCTNCAMIAQSTFFMHSEHGRARVFSQWGDDDETIQIAIETCPVDCIHYVPYDELVLLEQERRSQNINFKARLVSSQEYGGSSGMTNGVGRGFTGPQKISGNSLSRCNNCPSRGCKNCPMYGVGKNPEYERKEQIRLEKQQRRNVEQQRVLMQKKAEL